MQQPEYVFVIDGGATKTLVELRRWDGTVLASDTFAGCNLYQNARSGAEALRLAVMSVGRDAGVDPVQAWVSAGVAGASFSGGRAYFRKAFKPFRRSLISGDGYAALVGAFGRAPGALLSIGTGVVGCRFDAQGNYTQLGGWGFQAGDRGGGGWLGLQLVTAWLEHRDGMAEGVGTAELWQAVAAKAGTDRLDILDWLRAAKPGDFGALVPALLKAAESGCDVALRLRGEAVAHIARLARAISGEAGLPVALSGGLAAPLEPYLRAVLGERLLPLRPISPLDGAWRIARGERPPEFAKG